MAVLGIPLLTALLILIGPLLVVGALTAFASIDCPELRRFTTPRQRPASVWTGQAAYA